MSFFFRIALVFITICVFFFSSTAQNNKKKQLQREYSDIMREIKEIQSNINNTSKERSAGIKQVSMLNTKIEKRQKLISNIESQTKVIDAELEQRLAEVENLDAEIDMLKKEYTKLILWLNKNHNSVNKLAFVMEAHNFKEAYHRIQYIKKYGDFRAKQSIYLSNQVNRIMEKVNDLGVSKKEKVSIIDANKQQQKELTKEKVKRDELVKQLDGELAQLRRRITQKNEQAEAINRRIRKIIDDEIRKEQERREAAEARREEKRGNTTANRSKETIEQTPEGILSNSFRDSRGNLPWPVNSGVVTSSFGRQPHPAAPDLYVVNSGIDIKTNDNAAVRSIYKGEVVRIFEMPTYQNCVMIKHGDYFTVYSYLKSVSVREGMSINTGQTLGVCGYDETHGFSLVNLQIWHYQNKQNPQTWLSGR